MTLPTIAGVQSRIRTIADRPPFMIIREMADALGLPADTLSKAFRRNREMFPEGYFFLLTEEEYRAKSGQIVRTSQGSRADLEQFAFTEKGALFLLRFVTGEQAVRALIALIDAFADSRDGTLDRLRNAAFKDEVAYIGRSKLRLAIKLAAAEGWSFGKLWEEHDWSAPRLGREVEEMRIRGYIAQDALFVPHYVYQRRKAEAALMERHAEDERQGKLKLGLTLVAGV